MVDYHLFRRHLNCEVSQWRKLIQAKRKFMFLRIPRVMGPKWANIIVLLPIHRFVVVPGANNLSTLRNPALFQQGRVTIKIET